MMLNIYAGWIGFFVGVIAGAVPGLFFHREAWLGGYNSWRRRMIRLAHISFFGLGFLNLCFGLTIHVLEIKSGILATSILLIVGAVAMPLTCYLSAWKQKLKLLFGVPAGSVALAICLFLWRLFT